MPSRLSTGADFPKPMGILDAPKTLCRVWLRFHETGLCQGMDAVFVFGKNGMEVWSRIEDGKSYEKLQKMLEPLQDTYRIALYPTFPSEDKEREDDWDPPSSLWENDELRASLGDSFARARNSLLFNDAQDRFFPPADEVLKQRLLVYAEQLIKRSRKIERYATDLPGLAEVATNPAILPELRSKAAQISKAHAKNMQKELGKLEKSLKYAFPRSREEKDPSSGQPAGNAGSTYTDMAEQIAGEAEELAFRVNNFLYPKKYTVDLDELRRPGLLKATSRLERMVAEFQKTSAKPAHN
jgi:hypothetical protein